MKRAKKNVKDRFLSNIRFEQLVSSSNSHSVNLQGWKAPRLNARFRCPHGFQQKTKFRCLQEIIFWAVNAQEETLFDAEKIFLIRLKTWVSLFFVKEKNLKYQ